MAGNGIHLVGWEQGAGGPGGRISVQVSGRAAVHAGSFRPPAASAFPHPDLLPWRPGPALSSQVRAVGRAGARLPEGRALKVLPSVPPGPPAPPQDVTVHAGPTPATVQVSWKPPALTTAGLSNGANVTGYGVYAKGQRVSSGSVACGGGACPHLLLEG